MKRTVALLIAGLVAISLGGLALAGLNRNSSIHLAGEFEFPMRDTQAQGQAIFQIAKDGQSVEYRLIASNIENVFMAHIHVGAPGANGPISVWLHPSTVPDMPGPLGAGRHDGVLATGMFTAADFVGPLQGRPMSDLISLLQNGGAYVNVHTNDGVAPTNTGPGDFPGGEIRGNTP
jgi:hypothetical protein